MSRPRAVWIDHGEMEGELVTPYVAGFVQELKDAIGYTDRRWDADVKVWWIEPSAKGEVLTVADEFFDVFDTAHNVRVVTRERVIERPGKCAHGLHGDLHLLPTAPQELLDAAYRVLAKRHHPDAGGNHADMVRINRAYDALKGHR